MHSGAPRLSMKFPCLIQSDTHPEISSGNGVVLHRCWSLIATPVAPQWRMRHRSHSPFLSLFVVPIKAYLYKRICLGALTDLCMMS